MNWHESCKTLCGSRCDSGATYRWVSQGDGETEAGSKTGRQGCRDAQACRAGRDTCAGAEASGSSEACCDATAARGPETGRRRRPAVAFRFRDPTGALAAFQWQTPAGATPSALGKYSVETPQAALVAFHNYLFRFDGRKPQ